MENPITKALPEITRAFERLPKRVLTTAEIRQFINEEHESWGLGITTVQQFVQALKNVPAFNETKFDFPNRPVHRYTWGVVTTLELVQSINEESYFSHRSALHLHELTKQTSKTIFLNIEQPKKAGGGTLTQVGINVAFKRKCRTTRNSAPYADQIINLLNGANTGKLGVIDMKPPEGSYCIRVTDVERTLIDATVRPIYTGGVYEVATAFEVARKRVSAQKIADYLRKLNYTYPYHQSIGYFMQRAGYKRKDLALMRGFEMAHDFHLDYQIKEPHYNEEWKLFVPNDL